MKKVLVTGSNGPLGFALKKLVDESNDYDSHFHFSVSKSLNLLDKNSVKDFFTEFRPNVVIHLAAKSGNANLNKTKPVDMFQSNFLMASNILENAKDFGIRRVIMASSTAAYPSPRLIPATESMLHDGPPSEIDFPYAYAKRLMEPLAQMYRTQFGLDISIPIVNGILGPKMNFRTGESLMLAGLIRRFLEFKEFGVGQGYTVQGDGTPLREYTTSSDLAQILLKLMQMESVPKIINIGNNKPYSVKEYAEMVAKSLNIDTSLIEFTEKFDPMKISYNQLTDNSLLQSLSKIEYEEISSGIDRTVSWFRENYTLAIT